MTTSLQDRFWAKVEKAGPDDCWLWTAATNEHGYGVIRPEGRRSGPTLKAHRLSAELAGMDVTAGRVLHSCDNPRCVNPNHLRVGSMQENADDMVIRNRVAHGTRRPQAKLSPQALVSARERIATGESQTAVADSLGVSQSALSRALAGKTWRRAVVPPVARDLITAIQEQA